MCNSTKPFLSLSLLVEILRTLGNRLLIHKLSLVVALVLGLSHLNAEENGIFIGAQLGYGSGNFDNAVTLQNTLENLAYYGGGIKFGVVAGYKHFFTPKVGLRYYAGLSYGGLNFENLAYNGTNWKTRVSGTQISYSANIDLLANFITSEEINFGGFIGLSVGGVNYSGGDLDDFERQDVAQVNPNWKLDRNAIDVALNIGLRNTIAKNHGIEVVGRIPFIDAILLDKTMVVNTNRSSFKTKIVNSYDLFIRYTYAF